jgi:hypothetical protein
LDFSRKLLVLDLLVAFEGDAPDHGVFDHGHDQPAAHLIDSHVLEQAGLDQGLEAVVDLGLPEPAAGAWLEIGTDGLDLDTPVPLDGDRRHRLGRSRYRHQRAAHRHGNHDQSAQQSPPHSHSQHHAQRALVIACRPAPLANRQIPKVALLVANFERAANQMWRCDSIFIPRRCQWATSQKSRYYDLPNSPFSHGT